MQDFQNNFKKIKWPTGGHFVKFIIAKFDMGYLCVRPYILFYIHGPAIMHFFALRKNYSNCLLPKVNQVIG